MVIDEYQHVALPKLMGAPAYARPPRIAPVDAVRPIDPDDLPLEVYLDGEEREHARELRAKPFHAVPTARGDMPPTPAKTKRRGFSILGLFGGGAEA